MAFMSSMGDFLRNGKGQRLSGMAFMSSMSNIPRNGKGQRAESWKLK